MRLSQRGRAEPGAERAAPDHDGAPAQAHAGRDPVLLIAAVALERAEVDRIRGAAVQRPRRSEAHAQVRAGRRRERRERQERAAVGEPDDRRGPARRVLAGGEAPAGEPAIPGSRRASGRGVGRQRRRATARRGRRDHLLVDDTIAKGRRGEEDAEEPGRHDVGREHRNAQRPAADGDQEAQAGGDGQPDRRQRDRGAEVVGDQAAGDPDAEDDPRGDDRNGEELDEPAGSSGRGRGEHAPLS